MHCGIYRFIMHCGICDSMFHWFSNHTGTPSTVEVSEPHYEEITHRSKEGEAPEIILNDCPAYSRKPTLVDSLSYCVAYTDRETVTEEIECSTCPAYSNPLHTCQEDSHSIWWGQDSSGYWTIANKSNRSHNRLLKSYFVSCIWAYQHINFCTSFLLNFISMKWALCRSNCDTTSL